MLKKTLALGIGLIVIAFILVGISASIKKTNKYDRIIKDLNELTDSVAANIGDSPTLENIQEMQLFLEDRKLAVKEEIKSLNLAEIEKTDPDKADEIKDCFENNVNRFVTIYQNLLKKWYEDMANLNTLREKHKHLDPHTSPADIAKLEKEMAIKRKAIEANIESLNALNTMTETYKSIFTE